MPSSCGLEILRFLMTTSCAPEATRIRPKMVALVSNPEMVL